MTKNIENLNSVLSVLSSSNKQNVNQSTRLELEESEMPAFSDVEVRFKDVSKVI